MQLKPLKQTGPCYYANSYFVVMTGPFTCHIIYNMLSCESQCLIVSVGEIKEKNKFKSCHVLVKTREKRDTDTNEVIRQSGTFDCEVAIKDNDEFKSRFEALTSAAGKPEEFLPCFFILRSFEYTEKNEKKLGKQLQLKRWWR